MRNDVRRLRQALGLSQADLATRAGVSRQTINSIEAERYTPSLPLALTLARLFDTSVEEIFHDTPDQGQPAHAVADREAGGRRD